MFPHTAQEWCQAHNAPIEPDCSLGTAYLLHSYLKLVILWITSSRRAKQWAREWRGAVRCLRSRPTPILRSPDSYWPYINRFLLRTWYFDIYIYLQQVAVHLTGLSAPANNLQAPSISIIVIYFIAVPDFKPIQYMNGWGMWIRVVKFAGSIGLPVTSIMLLASLRVQSPFTVRNSRSLLERIAHKYS